ncbi:PQQ-dependent sugar dehydrogenase [Pirellulimonas nuda]|uniref:PQQ-dependent sugar dehydrogenase n=1 Tax=Pirellulimonas nuda TaxID=2528009 RepID=UPI0018D37561|nr:PQQ-dependent sugar dehydrogenase [Pirellulimonas nuda]
MAPGDSSLAVRAVPWGSVPGDVQQMAYQGSDLYFATREGQVWRYDQQGNREATAFLDLSAALATRFKAVNNPLSVSAGLRGIAFHPDFAEPGAAGFGKLFTAHAENFGSATPDHALNPDWDTDGTKIDSALVEWSVDPQTGRVNPDSGRDVYRVQFPFGRHPVQQIAFNPAARPGDADYGNLYLTYGDAGSANSDNVVNFNRVQGTDTPLGSIVRINPLQSDGEQFTIPSDNPFVGSGDGALDEIYAYGFRHPQTLGFDPRDGRLFAADMGQSNVEEVNLIEPGANYGYGTREGVYVFTDQVKGSTAVDDSLREVLLDSSQTLFVQTDADPTGSNQTVLSRVADGFTYPVAQFDHKNGGSGNNKIAAVVGGSVYRGTLAEELSGLYLFGDMASDAIYYSDASTLTNDQDPAAVFRLPLENAAGQPRTLGQIVGVGAGGRANFRFGQDAHGDVFVISKANDTIYRLEGTPRRPGDYNGDGAVDAADYTVWRDASGSQRDLWADGNRDFVVDGLDYHVWRQNFGVGPAAHGAAVPEPAAGVLLAWVAIAAAVWRRRDCLRWRPASAAALGCLSMALGSAAAHGATTTLDGGPTLFDTIVIGDFDDATRQGWTEAANGHAGGLSSDGVQLRNNGPTSGGDAQVYLDLGLSTLPGVPTQLTVGNLPGQFDIVRFDLRFDALPATLGTTHRGDQFLLDGGPNARAAFFVNDGAGTQGGHLAPELPTDGLYHTYTIQRVPTDVGWGETYGRVRIDPINDSSSNGTRFSLDNVRLGRSNAVQPFPEIPRPELIKNGDFNSVSNYATNTVGHQTKDVRVGGSFNDFAPFTGSNADIDHWTHFSRNAEALEAAVGNVGVVDGVGELDGTYYLDAVWLVGPGDYLSDSGGGYDHGLVQEIRLESGSITPRTNYTLTVDFTVKQNTGQGPGGGHENAVVEIGLTDGGGAAATDRASAFAWASSPTLDNNPSQVTLQVSGADLLAASELNVLFSHVNTTPIPGFPGSVDPADVRPTPPNLVSSVVFNNVSLRPNSMTGDVNLDGLVNQADLDLAQLYFDGDGGEPAIERQNTLFSAGNGAADVLASLNLTRFDLSGDDFFDADDLAMLSSLVVPLPGDLNGDGAVDAADYTVWRDAFGDAGVGLAADASGNGLVDAADYQIWNDTFGQTLAAVGQTPDGTAVPEPTAACVVVLAGLAGGVCTRWVRRLNSRVNGTCECNVRMGARFTMESTLQDERLLV